MLQYNECVYDSKFLIVPDLSEWGVQGINCWEHFSRRL